MSASTLTPRKRLEPLATVVTWVFWVAVLATAIRVILALLGKGPVVFIGLGLITFARVMRIGAGMRAYLEGTV